MSIYLTVPAVIVGKQRPRARQRGKFVQIYTPRKTQHFEDVIALEYCKQYPSGMAFPDEAIELECEFVFEMPKSWSEKKKAQMNGKGCLSRKKPDIDNCMKSVMDALNGIAYTDDSQFTETGRCRKVWGEKEGVIIQIRKVDE